MSDNLEIAALENRVTNLGQSLSRRINSVDLQLVDIEGDLNRVNIDLYNLGNADIDLHEEIHEVANTVDTHSSQINELQLKDVEVEENIDSLEQQADSLQEQIDDMDQEHHEELHLLASKIDGHSTKIEHLEIIQSEIPEQIVLSESEYEALGTPEPDKFYYIYEEEL